MKTRNLLTSLTLSLMVHAHAQLPPVFDAEDGMNVRTTSTTTTYLTPQRIVWTSDDSGKFVRNAEAILKPGTGQSSLFLGRNLSIASDGDTPNGILLDFGREIHGGIEIVTSKVNLNPAGRVRIRFGESVAEAMSELGEQNATNDHAMRDFVVTLPWLGKLEAGDSGFRFVRIDTVDPKSRIDIAEISAAFRYRELPYLGSFTCSDERLNNIWMTGAYTVHLNMQDYLWDGIKRDRLVWVGDLHPEVMTISSVFGNNEVVPKSLDLVRDQTPLPNWMNRISSYSTWWILVQRDWYRYQGDLEYLKEQQSYLVGLLKLLSEKIDQDGRESLDGVRFLDWPSSENEAAIHAGLHALLLMSFKAGEELCEILENPETVALCRDSISKLKRHVPEMADSKQAAALLAMAGLVSSEIANSKILSQNGVHQMSTFYGYYMLRARALAGDYQGAMDNIREYWGAMLDLGATTFWEDFNIDWAKNAARIDDIVPEDKVDIHGTYGAYSYEGFRHSLCHGWASGPTAWLTEFVLGIQVLEPGCKKLQIDPHLGDLEWAKGTFPTPFGVVSVEHRRLPDGSVKTEYDAPREVEILVK